MISHCPNQQSKIINRKFPSLSPIFFFLRREVELQRIFLQYFEFGAAVGTHNNFSAQRFLQRNRRFTFGTRSGHVSPRLGARRKFGLARHCRDKKSAPAKPSLVRADPYGDSSPTVCSVRGIGLHQGNYACRALTSRVTARRAHRGTI